MILLLHSIYPRFTFSLSRSEKRETKGEARESPGRHCLYELSFTLSLESMDRLLGVINYGLLVPPCIGVVFNFSYSNFPAFKRLAKRDILVQTPELVVIRSIFTESWSSSFIHDRTK
jgi:hypothetical protein